MRFIFSRVIKLNKYFLCKQKTTSPRQQIDSKCKFNTTPRCPLDETTFVGYLFSFTTTALMCVSLSLPLSFSASAWVMYNQIPRGSAAHRSLSSATVNVSHDRRTKRQLLPLHYTTTKKRANGGAKSSNKFV